MLNNLLQMDLKPLEKERFKKTAEATDDLTGNKIAGKITRVSKPSPQNNSVKNEEDIFREKYISPKKDRKLLMI